MPDRCMSHISHISISTWHLLDHIYLYLLGDFITIHFGLVVVGLGKSTSLMAKTFKVKEMVYSPFRCSLFHWNFQNSQIIVPSAACLRVNTEQNTERTLYLINFYSKHRLLLCRKCCTTNRFRLLCGLQMIKNVCYVRVTDVLPTCTRQKGFITDTSMLLKLTQAQIHAWKISFQVVNEKNRIFKWAVK